MGTGKKSRVPRGSLEKPSGNEEWGGSRARMEDYV